MIDDRSLPIPPAAPAPQAEKPFVIVLERLEETPSGSFRPGAFLKITPALCYSGLLAALPAEDLKTLLALFTLLSPNGAILPTARQIADALHSSEGEVMARLERLMGFLWQEQPLL